MTAPLLHKHPWYVYLLSCSDDTLYCGMTKDLERRLNQHNRGRSGAKYTRARRPVSLVFAREFPDRASAGRFEYQLKQMDRARKLQLLAETSETLPVSLRPDPPGQ